MEQKMEKGTGLSLRQKQFLAVVLQTEEILKQFYLSGRTALSSWYLHHRESYDLDFFSDRPFNGEKITHWIKQNEKKLEFQSLAINDDFGFYTFMFRYTDNSRFKVATEITEFPKMLVPFDIKEMCLFYERLAGTLKSKILK